MNVPPPISKTLKEPLIDGIRDEYLALAAPVIAYWVVSMIFYFIDKFELLEKYRIHTPKEVMKRNKCSVFEVVRAVALQHLIQTGIGILFDYFDEPQYTGHESHEIWNMSQKYNLSIKQAELVYYYGMPTVKIAIGFLIMDTWQYMLHRIMHMNKFLYKHLHSVHHRLYIPYAFGALYNSIIEGFLLDTMGAAIASQAMSMTPRETIIFFTFATVKTVDDHCGYELPFDPFQLIFPNNAVYHDIHHQSFGIKTNFSQPFFIHWDKLFNTDYKDTKTYIERQRQIRLERYNQHLDNKTARNEKKDL